MLAAAFLIISIFVGRGGTQQTIQRFGRREISHATAFFEAQRDQNNRSLRRLCRALADGPRLKATIDTPGIDELTLKDILADLQQQLRLELLAVLTPNGRVKAVVGADYLRGVDLSSSSLMRGPEVLSEGASGVWVVGDQVIEMSAVGMHLGDRVVGYILAGAALTPTVLEGVHRLTGSGVALVVGDKIVAAAPQDRSFDLAFEALAAERSSFGARSLTAGGTPFVASLSEIGTTPTLAPIKMIWVQSLAQSVDDLRFLSLLLFWVPLAYTVLFAAMFLRLMSQRG